MDRPIRDLPPPPIIAHRRADQESDTPPPPPVIAPPGDAGAAIAIGRTASPTGVIDRRSPSSGVWIAAATAALLMLAALSGIPLGWYGGAADSYQAHLDRAASAADRGDLDTAIESLRSALRHCETAMDPGDACRLELRTRLAAVLIERGDRADAAILLREALDAAADDDPAVARAKSDARALLATALSMPEPPRQHASSAPASEPPSIGPRAPQPDPPGLADPANPAVLQALLVRGEALRFADAARTLDRGSAEGLAATDLRRGFAEAFARLDAAGDLDGAAWFATVLLGSLPATPPAQRISSDDDAPRWHLALLRLESARLDFDAASDHGLFLLEDADASRLPWRDPAYEAIVLSIEVFSEAAGRAGRHDLAESTLERLHASLSPRIPSSGTLSEADATRLARFARRCRDAGLYSIAAARYAEVLRSARERGVDDATLLDLRLDEARARWCRDGGQPAVLHELARLAIAKHGGSDPGPGAILAIVSRLNGAQANLGLGRLDAATADLAEASNAILRTLDRDHPFWLDATALAAQIAQQQGRASDTAERAGEAALLAERLGGPLHPRRTEMLELLAKARRALGDDAAAARLDEELQAIEAWRRQRPDRRG